MAKSQLTIGNIVASATVSEPTLKKRGNQRNVRAGHGYERENRDDFRKAGYPHVVTSRSESRSRDGQKIDLINKDEHTNGRLPYNVQSKNSAELINYANIFCGYTKMVKNKKGEKVQAVVPPMGKCKGVVNVIFHKHTRKTLKTIVRGPRAGQVEEIFEKIGEYAILSKEDFMNMVTELKRLKDKENGSTD